MHMESSRRQLRSLTWLAFLGTALVPACSDDQGSAEPGESQRAASPTTGQGGGGATTGSVGTGGGGDGGDGAGGIPGSGNWSGLRAFPSAEGFGTDTPGGRGGKVYAVTTLDWSGAGSFSEALYATEPRIIVFRVSGVIDVPDDVPNLEEVNSYVTVAGQTSPGGVTFRGGGVTLASYHRDFHDGVFRFMRFRGANSYDNIQLAGVRNMVFDHCDFSGATDETFDITASTDYTVQWSTITNSGPTGQRYGMLLAYVPTTRITLHHNLSANHVHRCGPHMHWGTDAPPVEPPVVDYRNNVIYNCGFEKGLDIVDDNTDALSFNFVGNYFMRGPATPVQGASMLGIGDSLLFESDNVYVPDGAVLTVWSNPVLADAPADVPPVTTHSASDARDVVLERAGAWPRDAMNDRTLAEISAGTGELGNVTDALIDSGPPPPADADGDGMDDTWELANGLDPADATDGTADRNGDGYTNVEEYLELLAQQRVGG